MLLKGTFASPLLKHRREGGEEKRQLHKQLPRFLRYTQTQKARKGVTLYEFKHQNSLDVVLVLCCSCLNFELLPFASISFKTLSMYFVDWFNFASVNTIMLTFSRNSRE